MAKKSAKAGSKSTFLLDGAEPPITPLSLEQSDMASEEQGVSVSLKYYRQETECFSEWSPGDLKKFSATIAKIKNLSATSLRNHSLCGRHKRTPKSKRFSRPDELSAELPFFELRVDQHNAARIHGVFIGSIFHLVWLDRHHEVYPE